MKNRAFGSERRSGMMVAMALVCVLVVAVLGTALLRALLLQHRLSLREQHQIQALWLAESAVHRAAARLAGSADYEGETWKIERQAFGDRWSGSAVINVEQVEADERIRRIIVEAQYPDDVKRRVVQRREVLVRLPVSGDAS